LDDFEYAGNPVNFCRRSDGEFNSFGPDYNRYRNSVRRYQPGGYNYGSVIRNHGVPQAWQFIFHDRDPLYRNLYWRR
jgi:hypothetical protein